MQEKEYWQATLDRDARYDGRFVFAVRSTGIYCRPSCPARRPRREHVQFFAAPAQAEQAGFRACRRCRPDRAAPDQPQLGLVREICRYLSGPVEHMPTLEELSARFHLSPYHLQRTFKRLVGVTPRQYAAAQRLARLKQELKNGGRVTDSLYEAGYGSSSSFYGGPNEDLGMTPSSYRNGGAAARILYAIVPCPLGWLLVAATERGLCAVRLGDSERELEQTLREEFPAARLVRSEAELGQWVQRLLDYLEGAQPHLDLPLDVQATAFERRVWEMLRTIPYGEKRSYTEVARAIGQPRAARAVAQACAHNPVALVIPCHRVVRGDGSPGGYRWGVERKRQLLAAEARAHAATGEPRGG